MKHRWCREVREKIAGHPTERPTDGHSAGKALGALAELSAAWLTLLPAGRTFGPVTDASARWQNLRPRD
jgi:hypothetical protein